jgi:hypothetical protein
MKNEKELKVNADFMSGKYSIRDICYRNRIHENDLPQILSWDLGTLQHILIRNDLVSAKYSVLEMCLKHEVGPEKIVSEMEEVTLSSRLILEIWAKDDIGSGKYTLEDLYAKYNVHPSEVEGITKAKDAVDVEAFRKKIINYDIASGEYTEDELCSKHGITVEDMRVLSG